MAFHRANKIINPDARFEILFYKADENQLF